MFKYTLNTLKKLETILGEAGYLVRYERGNFNAGYCILEHKKVIVINRYFETDARINSLSDIMSKINFDEEKLSPTSKVFLNDMQAQTVSK